MNDECRAEFNSWFDAHVVYTPDKEALFIAWQAAWNARSAPVDEVCPGYDSLTIRERAVYRLAYNRGVLDGLAEAASNAPVQPLPSPVRYTDGTMSREYNEQPEPAGDDALVDDNHGFDEWWHKKGIFLDPDHDNVNWFYKRKELAGYSFAAAQAPLLAELRQARERIIRLEQVLEPVRLALEATALLGSYDAWVKDGGIETHINRAIELAVEAYEVLEGLED